MTDGAKPNAPTRERDPEIGSGKVDDPKLPTTSRRSRSPTLN